jgi:hypothetical protein
MVGGTYGDLLPMLRAVQGAVVGTVIGLALFAAAVHLAGFEPKTDEEGGRLVIGFFALTSAGAGLGALAGAAAGNRSAKKKHGPATEVDRHPLFDHEVP